MKLHFEAVGLCSCDMESLYRFLASPGSLIDFVWHAVSSAVLPRQKNNKSKTVYLSHFIFFTQPGSLSTANPRCLHQTQQTLSPAFCKRTIILRFEINIFSLLSGILFHTILLASQLTRFPDPCSFPRRSRPPIRGKQY